MTKDEETTTTTVREVTHDGGEIDKSNAPVFTLSSGTLKLSQAVVGAIALCVTVGSIVWSGVQSVHTDISTISQEVALVTQRVGSLEEKDRFYDRLVDTRNQQISTMSSDIAAMKALLEEERAQRQAAEAARSK